MPPIEYETKYGTITEGIKNVGIAKYYQVFLLTKQIISISILVQAR